MRYLESPDYETAVSDGRLVVYTHKASKVSVDATPEWLTKVKGMLTQPELKKTEFGVYDGQSAILKANTLKYFSQKVRARLGIKRHGRYEWATAELHTAIMMQGKPYIPDLYAYGWTRSKAGFPEKTFSVTQNLVHAITLDHFAANNGSFIEPALTLAFDTLLDAMEDGLLHLDPWAGNFLMSEDLKHCWLIDLEFSKMNSSAPIERQLGFSFGFFYRGKFDRYMAKPDYLQFIKNWVQIRIPNADMPTLLSHTKFYLDNRVKRRKRFAAF